MSISIIAIVFKIDKKPTWLFQWRWFHGVENWQASIYYQQRRRTVENEHALSIEIDVNIVEPQFKAADNWLSTFLHADMYRYFA